MFTNKQENKDDLKTIIDKQYERLHQLEGATILIKSKRDIRDELENMRGEVSQIFNGVENMKKVLERIKKQNIRLRELSSLVEALDKKVLYQEANVPLKLIQDFKNVGKQKQIKTSLSLDTSDSVENTMDKIMNREVPSNIYTNIDIETQEGMADCKRMLFNEPEICPMISPITVQEFHKVPKYIIGRQTLETINSLINAINQTLVMKYTILSSGKAVAQKKGEIKLYLNYRKQQLDVQGEGGYLYFFTAEDYYMQTKTKINKTKLNLITALRHCKRLRESRIKNELRYVVITH